MKLIAAIIFVLIVDVSTMALCKVAARGDRMKEGEEYEKTI